MNLRSVSATPKPAARLLFSLGATVALALGLVGCGGSREPGDVAKGPAEGAVWQPTGEEGTVAGKVNFEGAAPKPARIMMDADAVCAAKHTGPVYAETVVVNPNGTLRNVFVYVKAGHEDKTFAVPEEPVVLDQVGCVYVPHVVGIQARQNLKVVSSDNTTHNIHPLPKINREWNISQPPGADPIIRSFSRPEVSIPVKCNQHPWMRAYVHVVSHPFYSVSGDDGTFKLEGLPPGDYEIEAVHETYGAMTQKISVKAKETASLDFTYSAKQAYRPSSLKMMPALVLPCCGRK
jgi:hypothetical protein